MESLAQKRGFLFFSFLFHFCLWGKVASAEKRGGGSGEERQTPPSAPGLLCHAGFTSILLQVAPLLGTASLLALKSLPEKEGVSLASLYHDLWSLISNFNCTGPPWQIGGWSMQDAKEEATSWRLDQSEKPLYPPLTNLGCQVPRLVSLHGTSFESSTEDDGQGKDGCHLLRLKPSPRSSDCQPHFEDKKAKALHGSEHVQGQPASQLQSKHRNQVLALPSQCIT